MTQLHSLKRLFSRFFPRRALPATYLEDPQQWAHLPAEQKKELAEHYVAAGELALLNDNLVALSYFETALLLMPQEAELWYREGCAFFDYGMTASRERALLLASRYFKFASQLAPQTPKIWAAWGSLLFQLGIAYEEFHFCLDAKEKFQRAITCSEGMQAAALANLYWNYGLVWTEIAEHSGEAIDIRCAIEAFDRAMSDRVALPPPFWHDCGNAYLQMGLLINNSQLYLRAVHFLRRSVQLAPSYIDGWAALAEAFSQLYINTMDERYVSQASDCYEQLCTKISPDVDHWLGWAELLGESGRLTRDVRKLRLAVEKAREGLELDPSHSLLICQWVESLSILGMQTNRLDLLIEAENKILHATDQFPDDPDLWHAYGVCLIGFGQYYSDPDYYEYAIEKLQIGLSLDRTYAELWHALALSHFYIARLTDDVDMVDRATRFFAKALDLKPACPSLIFDAANAHLLSCDLHDDPNALDQAIHLYEMLLQMQKEVLLHHPEWLFHYAISLEWLGEYLGDDAHLIRAADLYLHVLLIDPETPTIYFRIAACLMHLAESTHESDYLVRALHYFRFAVRQEEDDDAVWLEWGLALIQLANWTSDPHMMSRTYGEAEQKLLHAGSLGNLHAYYMLASLYSIVGQTSEAIEWLHKSEQAGVLPPLEEMLDDEWLDNLRHTEGFTQFLSRLETKHGNGTPDF